MGAAGDPGWVAMVAQGKLTCLVLLPIPCVPVAHKRAGVVLIQVQLRQHSLPVGGAQEGAGLALTIKSQEVKTPSYSGPGAEFVSFLRNVGGEDILKASSSRIHTP